MVTCESTKSYKIPLKSCHNSIIEHNHVTICFSVEWPVKGGDDPKLVVDITDKRPSISYGQQNQSLSSVFVNSVHHHQQQQQQQQQENFPSTYQQQQQQYYLQHHSSAPHNQDISRSTTTTTTTTITSGDHNDVSSTTATVLYDVIQPQAPSQMSTPSAMIQQIKNDLKSQLSPVFRRQSITNQQYLSPQHVIQTPSNMNDTRLNLQMPTISPTSSIKQIPVATTFVHDLQQAPIMTYPPATSHPHPLICLCSRAPNHHEQNCPVVASSKQHSNTNLTPETKYLLPNDRTTALRSMFPSRTHPNDPISISSTKEPMLTAALLPFPNSNLMKTSSSSPNITTIVSQHSPFINTNPIGPPIRSPSLNTENQFQQQKSFIFPQAMISNQPNYQMNPSIPIVRQQNSTSIISRPRKTRPIKRHSLTNQDQISLQTLNISQQQNNNPPSLLTSSLQLQQGNFIPQDSSQTMTTLSSTNTLYGSTNDMTGSTVQQQNSPHTNTMVRSPVKLDISVPQNSIQSSVSPADIDETITDVVKGKGTITIDNISALTGSQQQQKQSSSPQLVWEQNGPVTTKTYLSPLHQKQQLPPYDSNVSTLSHQNVVNITQQVVRPSTIEQNERDTLVQQQHTIVQNPKRNRSKSTNNAAPKRIRKTTTNKSHSKTTSFINTTSTLINKSNSSVSLPISSSSGFITTPDTSKANDLTHDLFQTPPPIGYNNNTIRHVSVPNDIREHILESDRYYAFELDDVFSSKTDEHFNSSTPPPPPLSSMSTSTMIPGQSLTSLSGEKSSTTSVTKPSDVYEDFFSNHILSSSSTWQEDQVTSSVLTPPDIQNTPVPQQQYNSQTFDYIDSDPQPQVHTPQMIETSINTTDPTNNNDDVQTSSTQKETSVQESNHQSNINDNKSLKSRSKTSKQANRFNPNGKQTSTKQTCTRCGFTRLIDITQHEFPKQKGLVFECVSCGNNSLQSNVSPDERRRRLAKVAADHLNRVECQFCRKLFHSRNDYLMHLRNDHASNKPI